MYAGNPQTVLDSPVDIVMHSYHFTNFIQILEETSIELNRNEK